MTIHFKKLRVRTHYKFVFFKPSSELNLWRWPGFFNLKLNNFQFWFLHLVTCGFIQQKLWQKLTEWNNFQTKTRSRQHISHCGSDKSVIGTNVNRSCNSLIGGLVKITFTVSFLVNMEWWIYPEIYLNTLLKEQIYNGSKQSSQFVINH